MLHLVSGISYFLFLSSETSYHAVALPQTLVIFLPIVGLLHFLPQLEAMLLQRNHVTRLSVEILQVIATTDHPIAINK